MLEEEDDFAAFRLSTMSMSSVDAGLKGLEIERKKSFMESLSSLCCPCLAPQKKPEPSSKKTKESGKTTLQMQDFSKRPTQGSPRGREEAEEEEEDNTIELRSSFKLASSTSSFLPDNADKTEDDLHVNIVLWEEQLRAYEQVEESLLDAIPFEVRKDIRKDPNSFLQSEDSNIVTLATARKKLLESAPDLDGETSSRPISENSPHHLKRFMFASESDSDTTITETTNPLTPSSPSENLHAVDEVVSTVRASRGSAEFFSGSHISKRWAGNLSEMMPTQGKMSKMVEDGVVVLKVRPKWPDWLIDVVFDVTKTNKYGRRQKRQLKLTKYHIANIKEGNKITRLHKYNAVKHAYLVQPNTFVLEFFDEEKNPPLFYESILAGQIVQQISTRVQVRIALEDVSLDAIDLHGFNKSMGYSVKATKSMVEIISSEKYNRESNILDFARSIGALAKPICESVGIIVRDSTLGKDCLDKEYMRVTKIEPGSKEYLVKQTVEELMLQKSGPTGNTTNHFISKFMKEAESMDLTEIRHFIDGMHEYILENRITDLVGLLKQETDLPSPSDSRQRCDSKTVSLLNGSHSEGNGIELEEVDVVIASYIVYVAVEEVVFCPLQEVISTQFYSDDKNLENEVTLVRKMRVLASRHQHEWNIPPSQQSPAAWSSAIFELAGIERNPTPSMRLQALIHASKAIYSEFKCEIIPIIRAEKGSNFQESDAALGADDFLPIFIFVVCRAGLCRPGQNKHMLWKLCHPDQLHGESGYYLTVFESALEFIMSQEVAEEALEATGIEASYITSSSMLTKLPEKPVKRLTIM